MVDVAVVPLLLLLLLTNAGGRPSAPVLSGAPLPFAAVQRMGQSCSLIVAFGMFTACMYRGTGPVRRNLGGMR